MSTQPTDFSQQLRASKIRDPYTGVTAVEDAASEGYQANANNLKTPWTLPINPRPLVKPIGFG